ncbi:MAG TPA: hypothetical protein VFY20_10600 [Gemmatimonadales bacterium]|nr:hypothetical protein [Gemmatimonadales bacterium]
MAWRVVELDEREWNVSVAAERRAHSERWNLVLSFRERDGGTRPFWAEYPLSASSRSALLMQAEQIPNERLTAVLADLLR